MRRRTPNIVIQLHEKHFYCMYLKNHPILVLSCAGAPSILFIQLHEKHFRYTCFCKIKRFLCYHAQAHPQYCLFSCTKNISVTRAFAKLNNLRYRAQTQLNIVYSTTRKTFLLHVLEKSADSFVIITHLVGTCNTFC